MNEPTLDLGHQLKSSGKDRVWIRLGSNTGSLLRRQGGWGYSIKATITSANCEMVADLTQVHPQTLSVQLPSRVTSEGEALAILRKLRTDGAVLKLSRYQGKDWHSFELVDPVVGAPLRGKQSKTLPCKG